MEQKKNWLFRVKIFIWFIFTEPGRFVKGIVYDVIWGVKNESTNKLYMYIILVLLLFTIIAENRFSAFLCMLGLIFLILRQIWKSGIFIHRWRTIKKKD